MEVEVAGVVLARAESKVFAGAVLVTFLSLLLSGSPIFLLLLWCGAAGLLCSYFVFRCLRRAPNLLLSMKHPSRAQSSSQQEESVARDPSVLPCLVCNKVDCKRHFSRRREYLNPWDDLMVPSAVDHALSEVLELIMRRFVYSWHRNLAPGSESVEDELRVTIHHASAVVLRRLKKVDFSLLLTSKLLQPAATHIHYYMRARRKLPKDATIASIEAAVLLEYGDCIHKAMNGHGSDLCYFRHVARVLLPLVLPPGMIQSRLVCHLIEELFANKVFLPAMNVAAKPDFINLFLYKIFDRESRLELIYGPPSKDVVFLSKWALARSRKGMKSLEIPLPELLHPQHHLFIFMQFMKSIGDICILQIYLDLSELKMKVSDFDLNVAPIIVEQVQRLYQEYLLPSSPHYLKLDHEQVSKINTVLSSDMSASSKCKELKKSNVFGRLRGYIYHELLEKIYYPRFLHSNKFYEYHLGQDKGTIEEDNPKSKYYRWRQKTKQLKKVSQPSAAENSSTDHDQEVEEEEEQSIGEEDEGEEDEEAGEESIPAQVQVVDTETISDGIRPHTIYCIMVKRDTGNSKFELVKRRFKEFVVLDEKLRHFHGDIYVQPPTKKAFRNLDKAFVDARSKELQQYLQALIASDKLQKSRLLSSFFSSHSDPSLFLPDSVTEKVMKAVPNMLKRDKAQHLEELLQALLISVDPPSKQASPATIAMATKTYEQIQEDRENYLKNVAGLTSDWNTDKNEDDVLPPATDPVHMESVLDLLVFVAVTVYDVNPYQLSTLMLAKLLGQDTVEALVYNCLARNPVNLTKSSQLFAAGRIGLLSSEGHAIRLIELLKNAIFFPDGKTRTEEDILKRMLATTDRLMNYPNPMVVKVIGEARYRQGTALIVEGLQCMTLNKVLFFKFFDVIVLELFPELKDHL